jgi:FkbM family methyltransferase
LYAAKEILGANFYFPQFASQLERDEGTFQDLRNNLSDNQSKDLLDSVLEFRITGDVNYLYGKKSINPQYFEDFIDFNSLFTFFDVGAFDDENANRFVALNPNFKRIHLFEPNPQAYAHLKNSFVNNPRVVCSELAISDLKGQASFESRLGTSSRLIDEGDFEVKTEILDSFINESPDYIKFDIEGMELRALKGSLKTISQLKPNLAVSVYHESSHLFEVYSLLRHYYADAKFYLRLYTEGTDELILYVLRNVDKPNPL